MKKILLFVFLFFVAAAAYIFYTALTFDNVKSSKPVTIKIPTGASYTDVLQIFKQKNILENEWSFKLVSRLKNYPAHIVAGNYQLETRMNNRQIINRLRAGLQTPVTLVVYNIRTKEEFAALVGRTLEIDSAAIIEKLNDKKFCADLGCDTSNILTKFIADNYEFYWNISTDNFFDKLNNTYSVFWNEERRKKAEEINLTPTQVYTLASITEKEVIRDKELPIVAGVYLNRLRIGMSLQADPTLVFALRDFNAQRVTTRHKNVDSPYNTYKYAGLPPGPICMPRKKSIDAVLNAEKHTYLYFCANPDMSGYSIFSESYKQQMKVADAYRKKLNRLNIYQ